MKLWTCVLGALGVSVAIGCGSGGGETSGALNASDLYRWVGGFNGTEVTQGWSATKTENWVSSGNGDGMLSSAGGIAVDSQNGFFYVGDGPRIQKFELSSGRFVGAIGEVTASTGTCPSSGVTTTWCTGGTFSAGTSDGTFGQILAIGIDSSAGNLLVISAVNYGGSSGVRIDKLVLSTGGFVGSVGGLSGSTGTCPASGIAPAWCTGGVFTKSAIGVSNGALYSPTDLAIDSSNGFFYVTDSQNASVSKFALSNGAFVGAIGLLTSSSGTCPSSGTAASWCTGGTFSSALGDGNLGHPSGVAVDPVGHHLFVVDSYSHSIAKFDLDSGAFIGAKGGQIGSTTGTCIWPGFNSTWCTGGHFFDYYDGSVSSQEAKIAIDVVNGFLYLTNSWQVQKLDLSTGVALGQIGKITSSTGSCPSSGITATWCTGANSTSGTEDGAFHGLRGIGRDNSGYLYLLDYPRIVRAAFR